LSQIFDSLTGRRRAPGRHASGHPTAQGDAVLATLGYTRPSRGGGRRAGFVIGVVVAVVVGWIAWGAFHDRAPASDTSSAAPSPQAPPVTVVPAPPIRDPAALAEQLPAAGPRLTPEGPVGESDAPRARPAVAFDPRPSAPAPVEPAMRPVARSQSDAVPPAAAAPPDLMAQALYHHRAGDFESALVAYRALIQQNELNAAAHNNLGLLYQQKNLLEDAAAAFRRAIIIDARYGLAHNNYGVTLLRQGRPDAAAAQFRTVLELEPRNVDALVNLALADKAAGRGEAAKATLLRAIGAEPRHAMARYNLAVLHDDTGEHARALEHYRAFLEHAGADHADRTADVRARLDALTNR
jgi:Tfp pilus assembly protein PilF